MPPFLLKFRLLQFLQDSNDIIFVFKKNLFCLTTSLLLPVNSVLLWYYCYVNPTWSIPRGGLPWLKTKILTSCTCTKNLPVSLPNSGSQTLMPSLLLVPPNTLWWFMAYFCEWNWRSLFKRVWYCYIWFKNMPRVLLSEKANLRLLFLPVSISVCM